MEEIAGSAETIAEEVDGDHRYRLSRIAAGYLLSARSRRQLGVLLPVEWLYRTEEAARAGLACIMAFHAAWRTPALLGRFEALNAQHTAACERLNDLPLMGRDIREAREALQQ
jgi:hypothetical protein